METKVATKIASSDNRRFFEVVELPSGAYSLRGHVIRYDVEEQVDYTISALPEPASIFADLSTAMAEAKMLLSLGEP